MTATLILGLASTMVATSFLSGIFGMAGGLVLMGVLLALRIWRGDQGPAEEGEDIDPSAATSWRSVAIIAVAFLAHALLINVVGWPLAVTAMFGIESRMTFFVLTSPFFHLIQAAADAFDEGSTILPFTWSSTP